MGGRSRELRGQSKATGRSARQMGGCKAQARGKYFQSRHKIHVVHRMDGRECSGHVAHLVAFCERPKEYFIADGAKDSTVTKISLINMQAYDYQSEKSLLYYPDNIEYYEKDTFSSVVGKWKAKKIIEDMGKISRENPSKYRFLIDIEEPSEKDITLIINMNNDLSN